MIRMQYWEKMNENINNEVKKVNSVMKKNINLPCRLVHRRPITKQSRYMDENELEKKEKE